MPIAKKMNISINRTTDHIITYAKYFLNCISTNRIKKENTYCDEQQHRNPCESVKSIVHFNGFFFFCYIKQTKFHTDKIARNHSTHVYILAAINRILHMKNRNLFIDSRVWCNFIVHAIQNVSKSIHMQ